MSGTGWGGATTRRLPGLVSADGVWETEAVTRGLAELARRRDELTPRFAQLATRLTDTRELLALGSPPDPQLDAELAAARDTFARLYADARSLAETLGVTPPPPSGTPALPDVTAVLAAVEAALHVERERQVRVAEARRDDALATLERVARITYRGPVDDDGFAPLRKWQGRARTLGEEIAASELPALHPEVGPLNDGTHPFNHLLNLIDGLPTLDEPDYRRLVNTVSADFDEALGRAAGRGLLIAEQ